MTRKRILAIGLSVLAALVIFCAAPVHIDTTYQPGILTSCPLDDNQCPSLLRKLGESSGFGKWAWATRTVFYKVSGIHILGPVDMASDGPRRSDLIRNGIASVAVGGLVYVALTQTRHKRVRKHGK